MNTLLTKSGLADAAIVAFRFVKLTSTGIAAATAGTDKIAGVMSQDTDAAAGDTAPYTVVGVAKVEASAAIAIGAYVTATTAGKAVTTVTAGDVVRGIALEAATADGDLINVMLTYFHHKA